MMFFLRNIQFQAFAIFCVSCFLFTVGLGHQEIIGFEARFYLFAQDMWRHGVSFFPMTYHHPYPDYPATSTLLIWGFSKIMGELDKLTAVFPSAVAAALTVMMTFLIGALQNKYWGWYAVFFLLLTNTFVREARTLSPDQYVTLVTVLCFYLAYSARQFQKNQRLFFIPVLLLLGFSFRGPIGLVIPAGVLCVFYFLEKETRYFLIMSLVAILMLMMGSLVLFGLAYYQGGLSFVQDVWHMQVAGRMRCASLPRYFYFTESLGAYAITYPLMILLVLGWGRRLFQLFQSVDMRFIRILVGWVLIILVGLSIPAGKKIRYVLPMVPALALITASLFALPLQHRYFIFLRKTVTGFCAVLPMMLCVMILIVGKWAAHKQICLDNGAIVVFLLLLLQSIILWAHRRDITVAMAALSFVLFQIGIVEPVNIALNHTRDFVAQVEAYRQVKQASLVFYQENSDALPIKYMVNVQQDMTPIFIRDLSALQQVTAPALLVTSQAHMAAIQRASGWHVLFENQIGHRRVVVFEKD